MQGATWYRKGDNSAEHIRRHEKKCSGFSVNAERSHAGGVFEVCNKCGKTIRYWPKYRGKRKDTRKRGSWT